MQEVRIVGDVLQIVGVTGVVWDITSARKALQMRGPVGVFRDTIEEVAVAGQRALARARLRFQRRQPKHFQRGVHETLTISDSASVSRTYTRGATVEETVDRLWRIVTGEHEKAIEHLQDELVREATTRDHLLHKASKTLHAEIGEVNEKLSGVAGTHHGRRFAFAALIVIGLVLSLAADLAA